MIRTENATADLIRDLVGASKGSAQLDVRIALMQFAARPIVLLGGEPVWDTVVDGSLRSEPVPRYTRCLDAFLPGEDIVRVERVFDRATERWRAWHASGLSCDALTEVIARRLVAIRHQQEEKRRLERPVRKLQPFSSPSPRMRERLKAEANRQLEQSITARTGMSGLAASTGEPDYRLIVEVLCNHIRELGERGLKQPDAHPVDPFLGRSDLRLEVRRHPLFQPPRSIDGDRTYEPISKILRMWHAECRPRAGNLDRVGRAVRRLIEMNGDRPVDAYSKPDIRRFLGNISRVPGWLPKPLRCATMPVLLKYSDQNPGVPRVTPRTVRAYMRDLQALFNWAVASDLCGTNPANNLRVVDKRQQSDMRVAYDLEDLKLIFERSPIYTGCAAVQHRRKPGTLIVRDSQFWFPLFALFTGARLGEIAGATIEDFKTDQGIDYFDVQAGRLGRPLKTRSSDRRIPIHPNLVRMGFLEFVEERRKKGMLKVFQEIVGRKDILTAGGVVAKLGPHAKRPRYQRSAKGLSQFSAHFQESLPRRKHRGGSPRLPDRSSALLEWPTLRRRRRPRRSCKGDVARRVSWAESVAPLRQVDATEETGSARMLKVGDKAPDFTLPTDGGGKVDTKKLRGKNVIVYFYPKDDTPGCTREACGFRDNLPKFKKVSAEVIGISKDSVARHDKFKAKYELPFTLAADEDGKVCEAFGVWVEKMNYGKKYMGIERSTFLVDGKGVIRNIWRKVKVDGHVEEVLAATKAL